MSAKVKGFLYGVATSVTFGLIPLFTLPLMQAGLASDSILFYRFVTATAALGLMMLVKKESFRVSWRDLLVIVPLAVFYTASSMFLLYGYEVMGAGVSEEMNQSSVSVTGGYTREQAQAIASKLLANELIQTVCVLSGEEVCCMSVLIMHPLLFPSLSADRTYNP